MLVLVLGIYILYRNNPKYWDTSSTYHTCPKILNSPLYYYLMCLNIPVCMANNVDPNQVLHFAASNLG